MSMFKCNAEETAKGLAEENGLSYSFSVFDGKWYVGTPEQLTNIGSAEIKTPEVKKKP